MMATEKKEIYMIWTKTEKVGQIVKLDSNKKDSKWIYFTDSSRISRELVDEYMMRAISYEEAQRISNTLTGVQLPSTPDALRQPQVPSQQQAPVVKTNVETDQSQNVMVEMLKKMSVKNQAEMPVTINLPSPEVYTMLVDQMDVTEDDLNSHISMLLETQIDSMREQIKDQIQEFIIKYYIK